MQKQYDRRHFIKVAGASLATVTVGGLWAAPVLAQEKLSTSDPTAQALHFVEDVSALDKSQAPTYKEGSHCGDCVLYQTASEKDGYAPCGAFGGKLVPRSGWCAAWAAQPA